SIPMPGSGVLCITNDLGGHAGKGGSRGTQQLGWRHRPWVHLETATRHWLTLPGPTSWRHRKRHRTDSWEQKHFMESIDLKGRKALVIGVANADSLAWWAAKHFRGAGADLAMTYLNDKAKTYVAPLAAEVGAEIFLPCNVTVPG